MAVIPQTDDVSSLPTLSPRIETAATPFLIRADGASPRHLSCPPAAPISGSTEVLSSVAHESSNQSRPIKAWTSTHTDDDLAYEAIMPSRNLAHQDPTSTQSALLRFRYQVIPWMDSNNGQSTFGPAMMTLARSSETISDCIAYCMQLRDGDAVVSRAMSPGSNVRQMLLHRLSKEPSFEADVGDALIAVSDIFCTTPSSWASDLAPSVRSCAENISRSQTSGFVAEPLKALLRLHLKIGKATPSLAHLPGLLIHVYFRSRSSYHRG